MLVRTYEKTVVKRSNQHAQPKLKTHVIGVFSCDQCQSEFEIEHNLEQKLARKHHFCSRKCQGEARKKDGCLNYVYDLFENPFTRPEVIAEIRQTMIERYGAPTTLASPVLRAKQQATMIRRYGGRNVFDSPGLRHKLDFKAMARKRHETMKLEGTYKKSHEEDVFAQYLAKFGQIQRCIVVNDGRWPIDFYLVDHDTYVQFDGVYWHGLDRPIDLIAEHKTPRDVQIRKKWLTDREQERWFVEKGMRLIRISSSQFNKHKLTCPSLDSLLEYDERCQ